MTNVCEICGKEFAVTNRNRRKKVCSLACRTQKHKMATIRSDIKTALKELGLEAHGNQIASHYAHAKEKHPYFCDCLDPYGRTTPGHGVTQTLEYVRECNKKSVDRGDLGWHNLLDCETWEVFDALSRNDKEQAIEELYDCVAVCLRTIDVLKGWQKLGKPTTKGVNK